MVYFRQKLCEKNVNPVVVPGYTGSNLSVGFILAMGWDRFFFVFPVTSVMTDLQILEYDVKAFQISPRIGISSDAGRWRTLSV